MAFALAQVWIGRAPVTPLSVSCVMLNARSSKSNSLRLLLLHRIGPNTTLASQSSLRRISTVHVSLRGVRTILEAVNWQAALAGICELIFDRRFYVGGHSFTFAALSSHKYSQTVV